MSDKGAAAAEASTDGSNVQRPKEDLLHGLLFPRRCVRVVVFPQLEILNNNQKKKLGVRTKTILGLIKHHCCGIIIH